MGWPKGQDVVSDLVIRLDDDQLAELAEMVIAGLTDRLQTGEKASSDGWLDSKAAAEYLGVPVSTLHKLTAARSIPFEQATRGGKCYFRRPDLDAWRAGGSP
jgi:excisionase family DNA binding protein